MTLIKKWASALCLALLSLSCSNAETVDSSTGNLVNFTGTPTSTTGNWVNGVYVKGLTCWQWGDPGNCGPYPNVQTNGNINFSFGQVDLNQVVNVNNALQAAGTGVQVSGFNFGFRAKNGSGWDDGRQDYLDAYVRFYNPQGKVVESYSYLNYTNRQYGWTDFNFNETFNKPYNVAKLGAAQYGFIGRDNNFWAGPYGPEIQNVSFSLNYRIDPCVANPVSSPSCPGFSNLVKSSTTVVSIAPTTISLTSDTATTGTPVVNVGGAQLSSTGTVSAPDNIPQVLKDVQTVTQQAQSPSANLQQPQQSTKPSPNMSLIMNLIGQIQAADKATQSAAVQNAQQVVATSSAKAQEQANQVVESLNVMSQESSQSFSITNSNSTQSFGIASQTYGQSNSLNGQLELPSSIIAPISSTNSSTVSNFSLASANSNSQSIQPQIETQQRVENKQQELDTSTVSFNTTTTSNALVNDLFASKINFDSNQKEQTTEPLNRNVTPNDLAGNVDIASIATTPKGYEAYSFVLQDAAFYKSEAIYKDQRTVDNARLFRLLSSDRLHQEMVDQQYKLGK